MPFTTIDLRYRAWGLSHAILSRQSYSNNTACRYCGHQVFERHTGAVSRQKATQSGPNESRP